MPFTVRREKIEHDRVGMCLTELQVRVFGRQRLRLVRGQMFAKVEVDGMIQVEGLTPRQRPPGNVCLDVIGKRRIRSPVLDEARPHGAIDESSRLTLNVFEGRAKTAILLGQMHQRHACLLLHALIRTIGQFAVGHRREVQYDITDVNIAIQRRIGAAAPRLGTMRPKVLVIFVGNARTACRGLPDRSAGPWDRRK